MNELIKELMQRDGISKREATEQINEFKELFQSGELGYDLEEAFMEEFCLEPDFILDIF